MEDLSNFFLPSQLLLQFINFYNFIKIESNNFNGLRQKPISDGCIQMFICYHDSKGICQKNDGSTLSTYSAIFGVHNIKNNVQGTTFDDNHKTFKCISIDFKTNGFYEIFKIPAGKLHNSFIETTDVLGRDIDLLIEQLDNSADDLQRVTILDNYLSQKYISNQSKSYNLKYGFDLINFVKSYKGTLGIKQLIEQYRTTERTLQRIFKDTLGITPKEYCNMVRVNSLIQYIYLQPTVNWFEIINQYNYYDQTHMIKEFKSATTVTPEVFLKRRKKDIFIMKRHIVFINN